MANRPQKKRSAERRAANRALGERRTYPRVRARPIIPGTRVKVTRRCLERRLFLAPGEHVEEVANNFGYTLGLAIGESCVEFHAGIAMGNHHHQDITDVFGNLVQFKNILHAELAKSINAFRGRFDDFWDGGRACDTRRASDEDVLDDLVYTEVNPVKAGLVKWPHLWPGFTSAGWKFGETRTFKRPRFYHDSVTKPDEVHITRVRPKIFLHLDDDAFWELFQQRVRDKCIEIQKEMRAKGRRFKGRKKLAREGRGWNDAPKTFEERFTIKPTVATRSKWERLAQLQRDRDWEREYAEAREALRRGEHDTGPNFPYGTYYLRVHCGVRVARAP